MKKLNYRRERSQWICYDEEGNSASGKTVQMAKNNYELIYDTKPDAPQIKFEPINC